MQTLTDSPCHICAEPLDPKQAPDDVAHPGCCDHPAPAVETRDEADGVIGAGAAHFYVSRCTLCGSEVESEGEWWFAIR